MVQKKSGASAAVVARNEDFSRVFIFLAFPFFCCFSDGSDDDLKKDKYFPKSASESVARVAGNDDSASEECR